MTYGKYKDLTKRRQSDKVLKIRNKAFKIASNSKYDGYQRELASLVYPQTVVLNLSSLLNHLQVY